MREALYSKALGVTGGVGGAGAGAGETVGDEVGEEEGAATFLAIDLLPANLICGLLLTFRCRPEIVLPLGVVVPDAPILKNLSSISVMQLIICSCRRFWLSWR